MINKLSLLDSKRLFFNFNNMILSFLISLLFIVEMMYVSSPIFAESCLVKSIDKYEGVAFWGIEEDSNNLKITNSNNYIVIPNDEYFTRVRICFSSECEQMYIRCYFKNQDGFDAETSVTESYSCNKKCVDIITSRKMSDVKIKFIAPNNAYPIEMRDINVSFYNNVISYKALFAKKTIILFIIGIAFFYMILMFIDWLLRGNQHNYQIWKAVILSAVLGTVLMFFSHGYYWNGYFHRNSNDAFMDYFNVLNFARTSKISFDGVSYPAMCFLIMKGIVRLINFNDRKIDGAVELRNDSMALTFFFLALILSIIIILVCIKDILQDENDSKFSILFLFTGPFLFLIERGNILFIALLFLMIYYKNYNSLNKKWRYLAYVSLGISAAIKLYPALFGILTLRKKNTKETIHLIVIGMFTFFLPFFYFDGLETLKQFILGLNSAGVEMIDNGFGCGFSLTQCSMILGILVGRRVTVPEVCISILFLIIMLITLFLDVEWEVLFLVATMCVWVPSFSYTYTLVMYIPAILAYMNYDGEDKNRIDGILLAFTQLVWLLPMFPYFDTFLDSKSIDLPMTYSTLFINIFIAILFFKVIFNNIIRLYERITYKKNTILAKRIEMAGLIAGICIFAVALYTRSAGYDHIWDGKGSKWNPYLISNQKDFLALETIVNEGETFNGIYFQQTNDIEFDGHTPINPIGWSKTKAQFGGIYDGCGFTIKNYYAISHDDSDMGVFGTLSGTVLNLCIENCNIGGNCVGGIASNVVETGKIINCTVSGILWGYQVGGIASTNSGIIENCVSFISINSERIYGITENCLTGYYISCFSNNLNNTKRTCTITDKTLVQLNQHVEDYNRSIFKSYEMSDWIINDGLLKLSEN